MAVVFVYGTLTEPAQVSRLLSEYTFGPAATCHGLRRVDGQYPTVVPGRQVAGRLLATSDLDRLDSYEGVDRGLYCRTAVPLRSAPETTDSTFDVDTAEIYIGNPTALGVSEQSNWPESGSFRQSVTEYIEANNVRIEAQSV